MEKQLTGSEEECQDMEEEGTFAISAALLMNADIAVENHVPVDTFTSQKTGHT